MFGLQRRGLAVELLTLKARGRGFERVLASSIPARCLRDEPISALRGQRPDIIFARTPLGLAVGAVIGMLFGAPLIACEHGSRLPSGRSLLAQRFGARVADTVVLVARPQALLLRGLGFARTPVRIIPNGVATTPAIVPRQVTRKALGIPDDAFVVLMVAGSDRKSAWWTS